MKAVAVIPAHLASVRFPRKILHPIHGLPMIEHVRRRALHCRDLMEVYVATCDQEIADAVSRCGGRVIPTANTHVNGTSRVAEAIKAIDCTHVILLQGDEPLLNPEHVELMIKAMRADVDAEAWNATGPIEDASELDRHSFVKCIVGPNNRILFCCRRSPCFGDYETQQNFTRKVLGMIGYRKVVLNEVVKLPMSSLEKAESIEQLRLIENGFILRSVPVPESLPSINEAQEVREVLDRLERDAQQMHLLKLITG